MEDLLLPTNMPLLCIISIHWQKADIFLNIFIAVHLPRQNLCSEHTDNYIVKGGGSLIRNRVRTYKYRIGKNNFIIIKIYQSAVAKARMGNALASNAVNVKIFEKPKRR